MTSQTITIIDAMQLIHNSPLKTLWLIAEKLAKDIMMIKIGIRTNVITVKSPCTNGMYVR